MDMNKKSIGKRLSRLVLSSLLILSLTMGTVSVYIVTRLSQENSEKIMKEMCENEVLQINNELNLVSHSVAMVYEYAKEIAEHSNDLDIFSEEYETRIRELAVTVAGKTQGAMAVYFRYNPELVGSGTEGFFWSKNSITKEFVEEPPTDILAYYKDDIEHVGWFYEPQKMGKPIWMKPYLNQNLGVFMISYVVPVYKNTGEFLGVLGMDVDFHTVLSVTEDVNLYKTGSIRLIDVSDRIMYKNGESRKADIERLSNSLYNHITTINKKSDVLTVYDEKGKAYSLCYGKLSNSMIMSVMVPLDEINERRDYLALICIVISAIIFSGATYFMYRRISKIITPLRELTAVTKKYADGEWSNSYTCNTKDEIQELSNSISIMAKNTQKYIGEINSMARKDAMTGINNKTYYLERVDEIKNCKENNKYAVTVMDLNLLKKANDMYGHEAGDLLIKEAANYISRIFSNSEVFRIGGDEFVAISFDEDYDNREKLLKKFEEEMFYKVEGIGDLFLAISFGMAVNPEDSKDYDEIFKLADQRMYEKKAEMKLGRKD